MSAEKVPRVSSLVHPLETSSPLVEGVTLKGNWTPQSEFRSAPADLSELRWRHSGWSVRRQKTWDALLRCQVSSARLDRFANCGASLFVQTEATTGELVLTCDTCKDRWCVACQSTRAGVIAEALEVHICDKKTRFMTLTMKHSDVPLKDQIDRLYNCFGTLIRRRFWRDHVKGGAAFLEVKVSEKSGRWHPHLHLLVEGTWMDQRTLSTEWLAVTGDSSIVDIRACDSYGDRVRYVTKYVTKPACPEIYNEPAKFDEMIIALRGRRLCTTFGTWRGVKLNPKPDERRKLTPVKSVWKMIADAHRGDEDARQLVRRVLLKWPQLAKYPGLAADTS